MTTSDPSAGIASEIVPPVSGLVPRDPLTAGVPASTAAGLPDGGTLERMMNEIYWGVSPTSAPGAEIMTAPGSTEHIPAFGSALAPGHGGVVQPHPLHSDAAGLAPHQAMSPIHAVPGLPELESGIPNPAFHGVAGQQIPAAAGQGAGQHAHAAHRGDHSHPTKFTIPAELELIPGPADMYAALGKPEFPRDPPVPTSVLQPYWLEGKEIAAAIEREVDITQFAPEGIELLPTQILANVPDKPPEKLPEQPPEKSFFVNKAVAMSGQKVEVKHLEQAKSAAAPAPAVPAVPSPVVPSTGMPDIAVPPLYWMPVTGNVKGAPETSAGKSNEQLVKLKPEGFNVAVVRKDFPIFKQKVNGKPLAWLDNAATTQKPQAVIDRIAKFYQEENSNVHRAAHELAARATDAYEGAREKVRRFLGASLAEEIIFTRGTTESINLVAQTFAKQHLDKGDEIIVIEYEHHSNIVPWQLITREKGAVIRVAPILNNGEIDLEAYEKLFRNRTRMVAIGHVSNALGTVAPVRDMIKTARRHGAFVVVDGAQSVPHFPVDVQELDADFFAMSGHKLFGPTGVGVLYGKKKLLDEMTPWQGGGNMIRNVTFEHTTYADTPAKFEAGTAILAGAVGLGAAIDYLDQIGFANAARYEEDLLRYAQERIASIPGVKMIGTARHKAGVLSFVTDKLSPGAIGEALNLEGIAVRTGHHCAQPALAHFGLKETVRPSVAFYNTREEIDLLVRTVDNALRVAR